MKTESPLRTAIAGMVALAVAMGIGRFVYTPILPGMMVELGLSTTQAGLIASANYLGYLVGALLAAGGWAHGREQAAMLASLALGAVLAGLMGLTEAVPAFLAIRFLAGVASAFVMVFSATVVLGRLAAANRPDLPALHFGGVGVGIAASAALMAILVSDDAAWTAGWFWSSGLSLCGFIAVALLADKAPVARSLENREPPLPRSAPLIKIIVAYGLFGFGYIVTATFLVAIVRQGGGPRIFEALVWLATGLAGIPSVWLWQKFADTIGMRAAYAAGCVVESGGVIASVAMGGRVGPLLGGILLGGTFIAITALGLQAGRTLAPQAPRRLFAVMTASFGVGQILGPIAAGFIAERSGNFFAASLVAAVALLLSGAFVWSAQRPDAQP